MELRVRIQASFSDKFFASNVLVKFSVPKNCSKVHFDLESEKNDLGQATDYIENEKNFYWKIVKFVGGSEHSLTARITMPTQKPGDKVTYKLNLKFYLHLKNGTPDLYLWKLAEV